MTISGADKRDQAFVKMSLLQERMGGKVRCNICERRCLIVSGGQGWCRTRENRGGNLVTLVYGAVSSMTANPVEKKPFYHFYPGSYAFTAGSWSCNFGCPWCYNYAISKVAPPLKGKYVSPRRFIEIVESMGCQGTSISFNEPTLSLEWSIDVFRLARARGLYNTFVTNGYMTAEALSLLLEAGLDAMNVDLKGDAATVDKFCKGIDGEKVWTTCRAARLLGVHLELTTLVIPTVNDSAACLQGIAERIATDLGVDVPWHVTAYFPAYRFSAHRTPSATLERAWQIGKGSGLEYVYVGNMPGKSFDNTYCPGCGTLLIRRLGFNVFQNLLHNGKCPKCRRRIPGVWGGNGLGYQR